MRQWSTSAATAGMETVTTPASTASGAEWSFSFCTTSGGSEASHWERGRAIGAHSAGVRRHQSWPVSMAVVS